MTGKTSVVLKCLYDLCPCPLQVRSLRRQLDGQPGHQGLVRKYEQQLQKVREEVSLIINMNPKTLNSHTGPY